jgi:hypothetical protein
VQPLTRSQRIQPVTFGRASKTFEEISQMSLTSAERKRQTRISRRKKGLCTGCGGAREDKQFSTCRACRSKEKRRPRGIFMGREVGGLTLLPLPVCDCPKAQAMGGSYREDSDGYGRVFSFCRWCGHKFPTPLGRM